MEGMLPNHKNLDDIFPQNYTEGQRVHFHTTLSLIEEVIEEVVGQLLPIINLPVRESPSLPVKESN